MVIRWTLLATLLILAGCTGGSLAPPASLGQLPSVGAAAEDGLPAPEGAVVKQGEQPGIKSAIGLATVFASSDTKERAAKVQELTGLSGLKDGTFYGIADPPRASAGYSLDAGPDTLLGALAATPQSARLAPWLAHPSVQGYCYANDALALAYGLDRFLTSDALTSELSWGGVMDAGLVDELQSLFEVSIDDDFGAWWDGEVLVLWLGPEGGPYQQVIVAGVRNATIAGDKIEQMLAMYYFYSQHDRGVLVDSEVQGTTVRRLVKYGGTEAGVDLAYAVGGTVAAVGTAAGLELLLSPSTPPAEADPQQGFAWDAALLNQQPLTAAIGFRGGGQAPEVMSKFIGRGVGLVPGGGTAMSNTFGALFAEPGINRLLIAIEPDHFQWWVMGNAARNPESMSRSWNGGQALVVLGIAELAGWDHAGDVMAGSDNGGEGVESGEYGDDEEPPFMKKRRQERKHHKPFWRKR